jgi:hypothetical protein
MLKPLLSQIILAHTRSMGRPPLTIDVTPLRNRYGPRWQRVDGRNARRRTYSAGNEKGDEAAGRHPRRVITENLAAVRFLIPRNPHSFTVEDVSHVLLKV